MSIGFICIVQLCCNYQEAVLHKAGVFNAINRVDFEQIVGYFLFAYSETICLKNCKSFATLTNCTSTHAKCFV